MKFSAVTVACLATGAWALHAEPPTRVLARDVATITGAVNAVGQGLEKLDTAVEGFAADAKPVQAAADELIATLKESKAKVEGSDKLTLADALGLQEPIKGLQAKSEALLADLKKCKPEIERGGFCGLVRDSIGSVSAGSLALIKAVVDKVPTEAQPVAEGLAGGLKKVLKQADAEFSQDKCKSSGGGGDKKKSSSSAAEPSSPATSAEPSAPASSGATYPVTGGSSELPSQPTGTGVPTSAVTSQPAVVTAGAALVAPAGALAMAIAAVML